MPVIIGMTILVLMGIIYVTDLSFLEFRGEDNPPTIEFTWTPLGRIDLIDMRGKLILIDYYALDFESYTMRIVELKMENGIPVEGLIGRVFEQDVSLSTLHENAILAKKGEVTLEFYIKDDVGQEAFLSKTIKIKQLKTLPTLSVPSADWSQPPINIEIN